jgi:microcystin degradation protein MlrC
LSKKYRVIIAGFQHESNSFSPEFTDYDGFLRSDGWPGLITGQDIFKDFEGLFTAISGAMIAANELYELIPISWSSAEPYGPVTRDAFERCLTQICDGNRDAGDIDGIYLDLHSAPF